MVIIGLFLQSYPSPSKKTHTQNKQTKKTTKKSDFWKMKKIAAYNIILHMCTKNNNRMRYGSLDTEWDRHNFLSLLLLLLKKLNKHLEMSLFYICVQKITIRWCICPEIWSATDHWTIFCSFTPLLTLIIKIYKKCKTCLEILSFYTCVP